MVVKMHKQNTNLKPKLILLEIIPNYLKSYLLLKIKIPKEKIYSHLLITLFLNILTTTLFLGLGWSLLIYFHILIAFCGINSLILLLCEGKIEKKYLESGGHPSHDNNNEKNNFNKVNNNFKDNNHLDSYKPNFKDSHNNHFNFIFYFYTILFYFYISLLGLSYLPLYLYVSHVSSFLKPVALVVFMGFYNIFYMNNTKKDPITLILITINILVFIYLSIDHLELGR